MEQVAIERVHKGAALLDSMKPGWEKGIKLDSLVIASQDRCILGQTYGGYSDGLMALGMSGAASIDYGFCGNTDASSDELDKAWRELIEELRMVPA